jgi:hypothetical protein
MRGQGIFGIHEYAGTDKRVGFSREEELSVVFGADV